MLKLNDKFPLLFIPFFNLHSKKMKGIWDKKELEEYVSAIQNLIAQFEEEETS